MNGFLLQLNFPFIQKNIGKIQRKIQGKAQNFQKISIKYSVKVVFLI